MWQEAQKIKTNKYIRRHKLFHSNHGTQSHVPTAPQAQSAVPGVDQVEKSGLITNFTSVCLPTVPSDLYRQLSLLIKCLRSVVPLKPHFVRGCSACQLVSFSRTELHLNLLQDGVVIWAKGQSDWLKMFSSNSGQKKPISILDFTGAFQFGCIR